MSAVEDTKTETNHDIDVVGEHVVSRRVHYFNSTLGQMYVVGYYIYGVRENTLDPSDYFPCTLPGDMRIE